jgi:uncharacterized protein YceH (UPF0502 family)
MEPDAVEIRVVGCLLEKQRTTPDAYPLSLNALRLACNQATNRDPVVEYDEATVVEALRRTALRGWTRLASGAGSRARKYRHLLGEALGLDDAELSLLAVLMLRGAQTPGELKQRVDRLHRFADLAAAQATLEGLIDNGYVERCERRPGQKEERYRHLLGGEDPTFAEPAPDEGPTESAEIGDGSPPPSPGAPPGSAAVAGTVPDRLDRLERELAELRRQVGALKEALGETDRVEDAEEPQA